MVLAPVYGCPWVASSSPSNPWQPTQSPVKDPGYTQFSCSLKYHFFLSLTVSGAQKLTVYVKLVTVRRGDAITEYVEKSSVGGSWLSQACPVVTTLRHVSFQVQSKFIEPITQATPLLGTGRSRTNNQIPFSSNWSFLVGRKDTAMSAGEEGSDGLGSEGRRDTCDPGRCRGTGRMGLTRTAGITGSQCHPSAARGSFFKLALGSSGPDSRMSSFLSP